jgi:hypothetical protein
VKQIFESARIPFGTNALCAIVRSFYLGERANYRLSRIIRQGENVVGGLQRGHRGSAGFRRIPNPRALSVSSVVRSDRLGCTKYYCSL